MLLALLPLFNYAMDQASRACNVLQCLRGKYIDDNVLEVDFHFLACPIKKHEGKLDIRLLSLVAGNDEFLFVEITTKVRATAAGVGGVIHGIEERAYNLCCNIIKRCFWK